MSHANDVVVCLQQALKAPRLVYPAPIEAVIAEAMLAAAQQFTMNRAHLNGALQTLHRICKILIEFRDLSPQQSALYP